MGEYLPRYDEKHLPFSAVSSPTSSSNHKSRGMKRKHHIFFALVLTTVLSLLFGLKHTGHGSHHQGWTASGIAHPITLLAFAEGLEKCAAIKWLPPLTPRPEERTRNPRFGMGFREAHKAEASPILIKHAILLDGDGKKYEDVDILMHKGLIKEVGKDLEVDSFLKKLGVEEGEVEIIDVEGRYVTPGLVDQHSHAGVDSLPQLFATDDTNEMTESATVPQLRSLDGFNPHDPAIQFINSGGVTTSLILPGSGNLMGGEAYVIKHRKVQTNSVHDMLLNAGMTEEDGKLWRWMKMACGENPKRVYGPSGIMPSSRLGEGWLFREKFEAARRLLQQQDDWCGAAALARERYHDGAHNFVDGRFPEDMKYESLVALLRGDVRLNVHCYETYDLEMMIRNSHEFGFNITTFHHALEAWQVPDLLVKEDISVAIFADNWGYKKEAYNSSAKAGVVLSNAGVQVAYKSDHPVMNSQHLMYEAAKAHHYGLDAELAIKSVTSVPAERLGAGFRIGRVSKGYDADVVIWDRHPLHLGAHPLQVFVDGYETFSIPFSSKPADPPAPTKEAIIPDSSTACSSADTYSVKNIAKLYADEKTVLTDATIVVKDGAVVCIGKEENCKPQGDIYDLNGGTIIPGVVAPYSPFGLEEISQESTTHDGRLKGFDPAQPARAADGLRVGDSQQLTAAYRAGVLTAVAVPKAEGVVKGLSVGFAVGAENYADAVIKDVTALHVAIGDDVKDGKTVANAVSGQIGLLRRLLTEATSHAKDVTNVTADSPWVQVVKSDLRLVVRVHEANDISRIVRLKQEVENLLGEASKHGRKLQVTIVGAEEAWVVADQLAKSGIGVILSPPRCMPSTWESRRCRLPSSRPTSIELLHKAGVCISFSPYEEGDTRALLWEAGWAVADATNGITDLGERDAVGFVTWNAANLSGVGEEGGRIRVGKRARFVAFNGSPVVLGTKVQVLADGRKVVCRPEQD